MSGYNRKSNQKLKFYWSYENLPLLSKMLYDLFISCLVFNAELIVVADPLRMYQDNNLCNNAIVLNITYDCTGHHPTVYGMYMYITLLFRYSMYVYITHIFMVCMRILLFFLLI